MDLDAIIAEELEKISETDLDRKVRLIEQETSDFLNHKDPLLEDIKLVKNKIADFRKKMLKAKNVRNHRLTSVNKKNHELRQSYKLEISKLQDQLEALETEFKGREKAK